MNCEVIGQAMCKVTEELLWKPRQKWAQNRLPGVELGFRVGRGRRTCLAHSNDHAVDAQMTITYGLQMIKDKTDPSVMCHWLSTKEVYKRGYYHGELNLLNVLSHTIAHEFGHFVQVVLGRRYDGSVHNDEFYQILDRIHAGAEGESIRANLHAACMDLGMDLRTVRPRQQDLNMLNGLLPTGEAPLTMAEIKVGQELRFIDKDLQQFNPVRVVNKKRTRITIESVKAPCRRWTAKPQALSLPDNVIIT